jgi:hypothetical protein
MPTPTYTPLATVTLGSSASTVTFSNIPAIYRDLILIGTGAATSAAGIAVRYNGDTSSNYFRVFMQGTGSGSGTSAADTQNRLFISGWNTTNNNVIHQIMDYSATDKHKTSVSRGNSPAGELFAMAGRWANTSAITSITVLLDANNIAAGSTFSLYGVIA